MSNRYTTLIITLWLALAGNAAFAQDTAIKVVTDADTSRIIYLIETSDSLLKLGKGEQALQYARNALHLSRQGDYERGEAAALVHIGNVWAKRGRYHRALVQFSKSMKLRRTFHDRTKVANLYHDMSIAFTNLKMYPQGLKYHYKAMALVERNQALDSTYSYLALRQRIKPKWISDSTAAADQRRLYSVCDGDFLSDVDTVETNGEEKEVPSVVIGNADEISSYFNDGKVAAGYGVMMHVKQPAPGKRKTFRRITIVGHVFITLIKFNADCSTTSRTFGFYPKRTHLLSATPLRPSDLSTFKNDAKHNWDEVVGKLITKPKFEKILQLVQNYKGKKYHLNTSNCTDFGLDAVAIAGITINNTKGSWPGGSGNNPGSTGESILEGQIMDTDSTGLFIYSSVKKK